MDDLRKLQLGKPLLQLGQRGLIIPRQRVAPFKLR